MKRSKISSAVSIALGATMFSAFGGLKPVVETLDEVPEALHDQYKKASDGKYILELDGVPRGFIERKVHDEFRDNNVKLKKQLEDYESTFKEVDPDKYRDLLEKEEKLNDQKLVDAGKVDELVEQKVAKVREDSAAQVENAKKEREKAETRLQETNRRLSSLAITTEAQREIDGLDVRLRRGAQPDFLARVQNTFHYEDDGKIVARDPDGNTRYNKESDPMSMRDYIGELVETAPHLFEESQGGGGSGDRGNNNGPGATKRIPKGSKLGADDIAAVAGGEATYGGS